MISYDVTATIVIYQNNQMAAVSISFKFLTYADTLLCIKLLLGSWPREETLFCGLLIPYTCQKYL